MKTTPGTEGTLAELADPEFAIDPQWIVYADVAVESRSTREISAADQWIVWSDSAGEVEWVEGELDHLIGPPRRGS